MATKKKLKAPTPLTSAERKTLSVILSKARAFKAFNAAQKIEPTAGTKRQKK